MGNCIVFRVDPAMIDGSILGVTLGQRQAPQHPLLETKPTRVLKREAGRVKYSRPPLADFTSAPLIAQIRKHHKPVCCRPCAWRGVAAAPPPPGGPCLAGVEGKVPPPSGPSGAEGGRGDAPTPQVRGLSVVRSTGGGVAAVGEWETGTSRLPQATNRG